MDLHARTQNLIKDTLGQAENLEQVRRFLDEEAPPNRTALATQVCDWHGFLDHRCQRQLSTCLKALRDLEQQGHFTLPPPSFKQAQSSPRRLPGPVPEPRGFLRPPARCKDWDWCWSRPRARSGSGTS